MTVVSTTVASTALGNGSNTIFAIGFPFFDAAQVNVELEGVAQSSPADYSISGTNIVFTVAPPNGDEVYIYRYTSPVQTADYQDNGAFPAEVHERVLDRMTMMIQEQAATIAILENRVTALETP